MHIVMFTNTYAPMVGGAEKSVEVFSEDLRQAGHRVLIVTPAFEGAEQSTDLIVRLPSIKNLGDAGYSFRLPSSPGLNDRLKTFQPDIIHCHQPFHLGDTALRYARQHGLPLVYTHHTLYERYLHERDADSDILRRLAVTLPSEFANLCDLVIAPTESIAEMLRQRGVTRPIRVVPTGIDVARFASGDRRRARRRWKIDESAPVVGHVGRLIPAKNLDYLARALSAWLERGGPEARSLIVGDGSAQTSIREHFQRAQVEDRVIFTGKQTGDDLADAYAAMDLFAFSSLTDTQGLVLVEAMSAGKPIVSLNATGPCDVIEHEQSGHLVDVNAPPEQFAEAVSQIVEDDDRLRAMSDAARERAEHYSRSSCLDQLQDVYDAVERDKAVPDLTWWDQFTERMATEWDLLAGRFNAARASMWKNPDSARDA